MRSTLSSEQMIITGISACPEGIHKWPQRSSNGDHTFGAAAVCEQDSSDASQHTVVVAFYADVFGRRTGEFLYPGADWDEAMQRIVDAKGDTSKAYKVIDRLMEAFSHAPLNTMVTIDNDAPPEEQVRLQQGDGSRVMTDSIRSARAFIEAAEEGLYFSDNLLKATQFVSTEEYRQPAVSHS